MAVESKEVLDIDEKQPFLKPSKPDPERPRPLTKSCLFPLAVFLYGSGITVGGAALSQYTYNYTGSLSHDKHHNSSLTLLYSNDSEHNCGRNFTKPTSKNEKDSADWSLFTSSVEMTIALPVIVLAGVYSDYYGRKVFMLLPLFGACAEYLIFFAVIYFELGIEYTLFAYGIRGLTGTSYTFNVATMTAIADTTGAGKSRSFHLLLYSVYMGIGESLTKIGSGYLIQYTGYAIPCAVCCAVVFMSFLVMCNLEETLPNSKCEKPPFCKTFVRFFGFFGGKGLKRKSDRWKFNLTAAIFFVVECAAIGASSPQTMYMLGDPLCFSSKMIGYYGATVDFAHPIFGALILKLLHFCLHDEAIAIISILVSLASHTFVWAFATKAWMIFLGTYYALYYVI